MAEAKIGDTVKVHYTGKLDDGTIFDDSLNREPLQFKLGEHLLILGFEEAVVGMKTGDWKVAKIPSAQAYGPRLQELMLAADINKLPEGLKPKIGQKLQISSENDQPVVVTITEITKNKVILDANHPLAGKDLTFEIKLMEILPQ